MSDSNKNANKNTSKKKSEKRTKDEASPGSTSDQPDKRPTGNEKSPTTSSAASASIPSTPSAPYTPCSQPLHMFGQYYPLHLQYLSQQQTVPPGYGFSPSPPHTAGNPVAPTDTGVIGEHSQITLVTVMDKLSLMKNRLLKLDKIDKIEIDIGKIAKSVTLV